MKDYPDITNRYKPHDICTFLKIQSIYKLLMLKQKEENIIKYFIFTRNQKVRVLRFITVNVLF